MPNNNVTATSRKGDIWDALVATQTELDKMKAASSADEAKNARRLQLEDENGNLSSEKAIEETANIKAAITQAVSGIGNQLEASVTRLSDVNELIGVKDKELKEIYKIERSVNTLEALAKTQDEQTQAFNTMMADTKAKWNKEVEERNQRWQREDQDHRYEFERKMKIESNELNDTLAEQRKQAEAEIEQRMADVAAKEKEQADAIARTSEVEAEMTAMKEAHASEVEAAAAAAKKAAEQSAHFKNTLDQKDLKNQISMLTNNNEQLSSQIEAKDRMIADLQTRLSQTNSQLQNLAAASLGAEALQRSNDALAGALDNSGKKK